MDKKLLVIKPPYRTFPMGFAYVLACLESNGIPFDFIDTAVQSPDYRSILRKNDYLAVTTGGLIGHFDFFQKIVHQVRINRPNLPIILGGNITKDINSDFLFDKLGIDYGIVGEAETSLPFLIDTLKKESNDLINISGLIYKDDLSGKVIKNPPKRLNLEKVNILPAWHHINTNFYITECAMPFYGARSAMPVLSGRGCVGVCSFCSPTVGSFQSRPIQHVIDEIEFLNSTFDFEWIIFLNEMFYPSKEKILEFCRAYQNVKLKKPWACNLRIDANPDVDTFIAMKEAGCISISAGIESGSDKVLKLMKKRTTTEQIKQFFRDARKAGLPCNGTFMVGNEGETEDDLKLTIDMVISEEMNTGESLINAYPGTLIYKNALKRGLIENEWDFLRELRFGCGVWDNEWINRKYLNISEIPNERFWEGITKELRRYNTFLLHRFQVNDIKYKKIYGMEVMLMSGLCPVCNHNVFKEYTEYMLLGVQTYCPNCFHTVFFNIYKLNDFISHFGYLCKELETAKQLVVLGTNHDAINILRIDYFGLNYNKIIGFLEIKQECPPDSSFIHVPILRIEDLSEIRPDIILVADDQIGDAELLLKLFYINEGLQFPRIVHLIPDNNRLKSLIPVRLIGKNFSPGSYANIIRKAVLVFSIQLLRYDFRLRILVTKIGKWSWQKLKHSRRLSSVKKLIKKIYNV